MILSKYETNFAVINVEKGSGEPFFVGINDRQGLPDIIKKTIFATI